MSRDDAADAAPAVAPETLAAQGLGRVDATTRALVPPLHPATTYERDADGGYASGRAYTRPDNPTYDDPEALLAALEGAAGCLLFASGMAAASAVFMSLMPGDHVVAPRVMYWALRKWLNQFAVSWGLDVEFVDGTDLGALAGAMRPGSTRLLWIETPANPTWEVTDIAAAAVIAHDAGARLAVDSTVATPVLTRPLELGADLVVHSATKYLNGHSDVLAGAVVGARADPLWQRIRAWRQDGGAVPGPFEAWLLLRGMRTLFVRVRRSSESALAVARHFEGHQRVAQVLYPGLPRHAGHAVAAAQMDGGFGGMLSLRILGGEAAAVATAAGVRVFKRATSLGGTESLIEHRASIEGPGTPVPADLLRLSIGLEDAGDLITDLEQALASAADGAAEPAGGDRVAPADDSLEARIEAVLETRLRPQLVDRGGDVQFRGLTDGTARLQMVGSPGAVLPLRGAIERTLRRHVAEVTGIALVAADDAAEATADPAAAVQGLLETVINPALAAHGGRIELLGVEAGRVRLRFTERCQGCAMADVTLKQGIEVILRERAPGIVGVIDATDHAAGTDPYFAPRKK